MPQEAWGGGVEVYFYLFLTLVLDGSGWSVPCCGCFSFRRESHYLLNERLSWIHSHSGHFEEQISHAPARHRNLYCSARGLISTLITLSWLPSVCLTTNCLAQNTVSDGEACTSPHTKKHRKLNHL
jgi:hypothetical protein